MNEWRSTQIETMPLFDSLGAKYYSFTKILKCVRLTWFWFLQFSSLYETRRCLVHFVELTKELHCNLWLPDNLNTWSELTHLTKSILLLMAAQWRSVTFSLSGCRTSKPASTNSLQRSKMPYLRQRGGGLKYVQMPDIQMHKHKQTQREIHKTKRCWENLHTKLENKKKQTPKQDTHTVA